MTQPKTTLAASLVAHRGDSDHYPENSLESVRSALSVGACFVEVDIQISKDNIAVLSHDASLKRMTGTDLCIADTEYQAIKTLSAGYPKRFAEKFIDCRIGSLQQLCDIAVDYPKVIFFIEIKDDCIKSHGNKAFDIVLEVIKEIQDQMVIISFNYDLLRYARTVSDVQVGWVIPENKTAEKDNEQKAQQLLPDYLFVDKKYIPTKNSSLWHGDWCLTVYTVSNEKEIEDYANMGFKLLETNDISSLIK